MARTRPIVLILSPDPGFARDLAAGWPAGPPAPEFKALAGVRAQDLAGVDYDLAVADASSEAPSAVRQALAAAGKPALLIHADGATLSHTDGVVVEFCRGRADGSDAESHLWAEAAGLLGREILRRAGAEERLRQAEAASAAKKAEATLGRYMVEMRHNVNNALTSVLGNAELLAIEPGLSRTALEQADTIRNMALRLNEVFQRFYSLEKELSMEARESGKAQARASGAD